MLVWVVGIAVPLWAGPDEELSDAQRAAAADSLTHSAQDLLMTPEAPARAARLVALAEMAARLSPDHYEARRVLADVWQGQEDHARAADALAVCLKQVERDQALWRQWLFNKTVSLQTADQRQAFFDGLVRDETIPAPVRAEAMVQYATVLLGKGHTDKAGEFFIGALTYDPYHPDALAGWLTVQDGPISPVDRCNMLLRILRTRPLDVDNARDLAVLLGATGLWGKAMEVFDYAYYVGMRDLGAEAFPHTWLVQYTNAMLDAGQNEKAVKTIEPILERFGQSLDLRVLLVEAYQNLERPNDARRLVRQIELTYEVEPPGDDALQYNIDMAMFYLTTQPDRNRALKHARRVVELAGPEGADSPLLQRLVGAAELVNDAADNGLRRLEAVAAEDAYAAYFLARHAFENGQADVGAAAIAQGIVGSRSGPAFRLLRGLARQNRVPIEPAAGSKQILDMMTTFGTLTYQMALQPERFITVSLGTESATVMPGEPIVVSAVLTNTGPVEIPLGPFGLCSPVMAVSVRIAEGPAEAFEALPMLVWNGPRYLKPNEELTGTLRIDVGALGQYLAQRPEQDLTLTISGKLDPVRKGDELTSALPSVVVQEAAIVRGNLLRAAEGSSDACGEFMAQLTADLTGDDLAVRMRTARQVGMLLGLLARVADGGAQLPEGIPQEQMHDDLLAAAEHALADASPVVRAEMLTAAQWAAPVDRLLLARTVTDDPSALVRLREAELIGLSTQAPDDARLALLAADADPLVAQVAEALAERLASRPETQPDETPSTTAPADEPDEPGEMVGPPAPADDADGPDQPDPDDGDEPPTPAEAKEDAEAISDSETESDTLVLEAAEDGESPASQPADETDTDGP